MGNKKFKPIIWILQILIFLSIVIHKAEASTELQLRALLPHQKNLVNVILSREPQFFSKADIYLYLKEVKGIYLEYGLEGLLVTAYYKAGEIITVEIYKMNDYHGAYGIFNIKKIPNEVPFKVGDGSAKSTSTITFWQDSFFVKLISLGRSESSLKIMDDIAKIISRKIGRHRKIPYPIRILPSKDLLLESVKFIRGPIGFKKYFHFFPEETFSRKGNVGDSAVAEYKGKHEFSYCLQQFKSEYRAKRVLSKIIENLKKSTVDHYYLFDVLFYKGKDKFYKIDRMQNYLSIFVYKDKDFKYEWHLDRIREKISE